MFALLKKKKKQLLLTDEDKKELREIERKAYMEEARVLIEAKARRLAQDDYLIKEKVVKESFE